MLSSAPGSACALLRAGRCPMATRIRRSGYRRGLLLRARPPRKPDSGRTTLANLRYAVSPSGPGYAYAARSTSHPLQASSTGFGTGFSPPEYYDTMRRESPSASAVPLSHGPWRRRHSRRVRALSNGRYGDSLLNPSATLVQAFDVPAACATIRGFRSSIRHRDTALPGGAAWCSGCTTCRWRSLVPSLKRWESIRHRLRTSCNGYPDPDIRQVSGRFVPPVSKFVVRQPARRAWPIAASGDHCANSHCLRGGLWPCRRAGGALHRRACVRVRKR